MKVLIIPYNYPTIENPHRAVFIRDHKQMLESAGVAVDVLGVIPKTLTDVISSRSLRFFRLSHERWVLSIIAIKGLHTFNRWLSLFVGKCLLRKYIRECSKNLPEVIHVHNGASADLALWCYEKYGIPYVVTEHSSALWNVGHCENTPNLRRIYQNSKANIAVSKKFCSHLSNTFGSSFEYVPNPVDVEFFTCDAKKQYDSVVRLLSVGNLTKNKNHQLAINSVKKLVEKGVKVEYRIIGSGTELSALRMLVEELNLNGVVLLEGSKTREEVKKLLCRSDYFLLPSLSETFGVVLIEAMACGLPVIALKNGGSESIITTPKLGRLVDNEEEFNTSLQSMLNDTYDHNYIREYAKNNFSFESISLQTINLYSDK